MEQKHFIKLIDLVNETLELEWDYQRLSSNRNIYLEDIEKYKRPTARDANSLIYPFSAIYLSSNPHLNIDFILKYPKLTWLWQSVTRIIPISDILKHPELPWNWKELILYGKIKDLNFILKLPKDQWDWGLLSFAIDINTILEHKEYPWDSIAVSRNPTVTMDIVKSHPEIKWNFVALSSHIKIEEIKANPNYPWDYARISFNRTLTSYYFLQNLDKKWDKEQLSKNPKLNFDILAESKENLIPFFNLKTLINNPSLTVKFILKYLNIFQTEFRYIGWVTLYEKGILKMNDIISHPELILNYSALSYMKNLEFWYIIEKRNETWDWRALSKNNSFKMKDILEGIEMKLPWDYIGLSANPNITFDFVYSNLDKEWNASALSGNNYIPEYNKHKLALRLERIYLFKKNKETKKVLGDFIINDLSKIVTEY